jgi:prevent-host-death family protein
MHSIPFSEARANLAETLREVETSEQAMIISRRGQAAGVLMSYAQYRQLTGQPLSFAARLQKWRAECATQPEETDPFDSVRDRSPGRDFSW